MKTREWPNLILFSFKTALLRHMLNENQHIHFRVHGHSSWSTFSLYLVRGPKAHQNDVLKKWDHGSWTMRKGHLPGSDFTLHDVNQPLCRWTQSYEQVADVTLWNLWASSLGPLQIVYYSDTKYHKLCTIVVVVVLVVIIIITIIIMTWKKLACSVYYFQKAGLGPCTVSPYLSTYRNLWRPACLPACQPSAAAAAAALGAQWDCRPMQSLKQSIYPDSPHWHSIQTRNSILYP